MSHVTDHVQGHSPYACLNRDAQPVSLRLRAIPRETPVPHNDLCRLGDGPRVEFNPCSTFVRRHKRTGYLATPTTGADSRPRGPDRGVPHTPSKRRAKHVALGWPHNESALIQLAAFRAKPSEHTSAGRGPHLPTGRRPRKITACESSLRNTARGLATTGLRDVQNAGSAPTAGRNARRSAKAPLSPLRAKSQTRL